MQTRKFYRINQAIQAPQVRLIDNEGKQIAVTTRQQALKLAQEASLDLVEIAPNAKPPVAKLVDFKKFLYLEQKKKRQERKKADRIDTKEIRFGPFTSGHDLNVKIEKARDFLKIGHKIKIVVKFTGRQMAHPEFGAKAMREFLAGVGELAKIEREPHFEGRFFWTVVTPQKSKKEVKNEEKEAEN